jgi:hypothetical protein
MLNLYDLIGTPMDATMAEISEAIERCIEDQQHKRDQGDPKADIALYSLREAKSILLDARSRSSYDQRLNAQQSNKQGLEPEQGKPPAQETLPDPPSGNLAACTSCGAMVAKTARSCPHCGHTNPTMSQKEGSIRAILGLVVMGVFLCFIFAPSKETSIFDRDTRTFWEKTQSFFHVKKPYDYTYKQTTNQYGVIFYSFSGQRSPPIATDQTSVDPQLLNELLMRLNLPTVVASDMRRSGTDLLVFESYPKGSLSVSLRLCDFNKGSDAYHCISRFLIAPDRQTMMQNAGVNNPRLKYISRAQYGSDWPFTVDHGLLVCAGHQEIYFTTEDNKMYALNGLAKSSKYADDLRSIWLDDPNRPGLNLKISVGGMIQEGLKLCQHH